MNDGENIVSLMAEIHRLYKDTALLLQTSDELFKAKEWLTPDGKSTCKSDGSNAVYRPEAWFPQDVYRFYKRTHGAYERVLTCISVIFYDREQRSLVKEALFAGACFDYGPGNKVENKWSYDLARTHLVMPNRRDDGTIIANTPGVGVPYLTASTLAVPLTSVGSERDLQRIVDRLLEEAQAIIENR